MTDVVAVLPEIVVSFTAIVVLMVDAVARRGRADGWLPWLTIAGLAAAGLAGPMSGATGTFFRGFVVVDA
ncbi:MAG: NADH:ubiquinone oxidoreductase subunit N, partial [Chloroflexota bacterium]